MSAVKLMFFSATLLNVYIILLHKKPFVNTLIKNIKLTLKNLVCDAANFFRPKNIIKAVDKREGSCYNYVAFICYLFAPDANACIKRGPNF